MLFTTWIIRWNDVFSRKSKVFSKLWHVFYSLDAEDTRHVWIFVQHVQLSFVDGKDAQCGCRFVDQMNEVGQDNSRELPYTTVSGNRVWKALLCDYSPVCTRSSRDACAPARSPFPPRLSGSTVTTHPLTRRQRTPISRHCSPPFLHLLYAWVWEIGLYADIIHSCPPKKPFASLWFYLPEGMSFFPGRTVRELGSLVAQLSIWWSYGFSTYLTGWQ